MHFHLNCIINFSLWLEADKVLRIVSALSTQTIHLRLKFSNSSLRKCELKPTAKNVPCPNFNVHYALNNDMKREQRFELSKYPKQLTQLVGVAAVENIPHCYEQTFSHRHKLAHTQTNTRTLIAHTDKPCMHAYGVLCVYLCMLFLRLCFALHLPTQTV